MVINFVNARLLTKLIVICIFSLNSQWVIFNGRGWVCVFRGLMFVVVSWLVRLPLQRKCFRYTNVSTFTAYWGPLSLIICSWHFNVHVTGTVFCFLLFWIMTGNSETFEKVDGNSNIVHTWHMNENNAAGPT